MTFDASSFSGEDSEKPEGHCWDSPPKNIDEFIYQFQSLVEYVKELEDKVAACERQVTLANLEKIEYRIGKLYVRELSGTLNIGITSIGNDTKLTDLASLTTDDLIDSDDDFEDRESWYTEERWFDD